MTTKRRVKIVFALLVCASFLCVGFGLFYRGLVSMFIYDSNLEAFTHTLTSDQGNSILFSAGSVVMIYVLLLVISNVLWIAGAWYLVSRFKSHDDQSSNKSLQATAAAPASCD